MKTPFRVPAVATAFVCAVVCLSLPACRTATTGTHEGPSFAKGPPVSLDGLWTHDRGDAGRTQSTDAGLGDYLVEGGLFRSTADRLSCLRFANGHLLAFAQEKAASRGGWTTVEASSGALLDWQPAPHAGPLAMDRDRIVYALDPSAQSGGRGLLFSRSIGQPAPHWRAETDGPVDSIALAPGDGSGPANVIVSTGAGRAACFRGSSGAVVWQYRAVPAMAVTNRPLAPSVVAVADGKVFLPSGTRMDILDAETGELLGSGQGDTPITAVASDGGKAYFACTASLNAYCLFGMTATWSFPAPDAEESAQSHPLSASADRPAASVPVPRLGPPSVSADHLVFVDAQSVMALTRGGELEWKTPVEGLQRDPTTGSPVPIRLVAQTSDGKVVVSHGRFVDLYSALDGKRVFRISFGSEVDDVIVLKSNVLVSEAGTVHCLGRGVASGALTFDVHPCAGEIHIGLESVQWNPAGGKPAESPHFAAVPDVVYMRDGETHVLGSFLPGCSGGLRVHEPPPFSSGAIEIQIRGRREDGTAMAGSQKIDLADY